MARADASIETPLPVLCSWVSRPVAARRHAERARASNAAFELSNGGAQEYARGAERGRCSEGSSSEAPPLLPPKTQCERANLRNLLIFSRNEARGEGKNTTKTVALLSLAARAPSPHTRKLLQTSLRASLFFFSIRVGERARRDSRAFFFFFFILAFLLLSSPPRPSTADDDGENCFFRWQPPAPARLGPLLRWFRALEQ